MHASGDRRQRQRRLAGQTAVDVHRRTRGIRFHQQRAGRVARRENALLSARERDDGDEITIRDRDVGSAWRQRSVTANDVEPLPDCVPPTVVRPARTLR